MASYQQFADDQAALSFMTEQATIIEATVYRRKYPEIQYPSLIPIETSGNEWAKSITFFSMDKVGAANWFHHLASDMPLADISLAKFEQGIEMAGIGYRYSIEEINQAIRSRISLTAERADAARRAYEEFMDRIALTGDTPKGWKGIINNTVMSGGTAVADGTGSSTLWLNKTADQMVRDVNDVLTAVYTGSLTVEMADTVLLPIPQFTRLAQTRLTNLERTAMDWLRQNNVYSAQTGAPLTIRAVRGLETAGGGSTGRMIAYRKDPDVIKLHLPMVHRFVEVHRTAPLVYDVPGIFRTGGVEIRRPGAIRYLDGL